MRRKLPCVSDLREVKDVLRMQSSNARMLDVEASEEMTPTEPLSADLGAAERTLAHVVYPVSEDEFGRDMNAAHRTAWLNGRKLLRTQVIDGLCAENEKLWELLERANEVFTANKTPFQIDDLKRAWLSDFLRLKKERGE